MYGVFSDFDILIIQHILRTLRRGISKDADGARVVFAELGNRPPPHRGMHGGWGLGNSGADALHCRSLLRGARGVACYSFKVTCN